MTSKLFRLGGRTRLAGTMAAVIVAGFGVALAKLHADALNSASPAPVNVPTVGVAKVTREDLFKVVTIPAEFRPYEEVELHAKVSGYLQNISVDFGDKVQAGQLLATLDAPELQAELNNAQATSQRAEADYVNAHLIYSRLLAVNKDHPNLVAQQELDTAAAKDQTTAAALAAARAEVEKYKTLLAYTQITAPFDGVVTRRYADPGALIQAGTASDTQAMPLVRVSNNYRLRLDFPVSVDHVKDVHIGDTIEARVDSLDGRTFSGTISRCTRNVNEQTRTMLVEIEVPNPDLQFVPGMYANVSLKVEKHSDALAIPTEAVSGSKSSEVLVVNHAGQIEERTVKLGLETPDKYEVLSGLEAGDLVVVGSRAAFQNGEKVDPKFVQLASDAGD